MTRRTYFTPPRRAPRYSLCGKGWNGNETGVNLDYWSRVELPVEEHTHCRCDPASRLGVKLRNDNFTPGFWCEISGVKFGKWNLTPRLSCAM